MGDELDRLVLSHEDAGCSLHVFDEAHLQSQILRMSGGDPQRTLLEIEPDGKIFIGEDRIPLEKIILALKDGLAALEILQAQLGYAPKG